MTCDFDNDGRFPDDSPVWVWYPPDASTPCPPRETWAWLPGSVLEQSTSSEWQIVVEVRELATLQDGSPAPAGTPDKDLYYPICFRDDSEIRARTGDQP